MNTYYEKQWTGIDDRLGECTISAFVSYYDATTTREMGQAKRSGVKGRIKVEVVIPKSLNLDLPIELRIKDGNALVCGGSFLIKETGPDRSVLIANGKCRGQVAKWYQSLPMQVPIAP